MSQELIHQVFAEMGRRDSNWNGYGRSRETAVRLAVKCCTALTSAPKEQAEPQLLPEREGQPDVLTMSQPHELESGHWYSPAAVRKMLLATQPTPRAIADQQATMGQAEPSDAERLLDFALLLKRRPALKSAAREMLLDRDTSTQPERLGLCGGDAVLADCPECGNYYLAIKTDVYKDKREFIYCDCCGAMATRPLWEKAAHLSRMAGADAGADEWTRDKLKIQAAIRHQGFTLVHGEFGYRLEKFGPIVAATAGEPKP